MEEEQLSFYGVPLSESVRLKTEVALLAETEQFTDETALWILQDSPEIVVGSLVWLLSLDSIPRLAGRLSLFLEDMRAIIRRGDSLTIPQIRSVLNTHQAWVKKNYLPFDEQTTDNLVESIEGLDLRRVPSGRYAAPDTDSPLFKLDNVSDGKWAGWVFVKDGSRYAQKEVRYGSQRPKSGYVGKYEDLLKIIASDPQAGAARYGQLTGFCGRCGKALEDPESVARGLGPVCVNWSL